MGKSLNRVEIIGNLGKDPEMKYTTSGTAITSFTVAVNRNTKDASGAWQEETEWVRCTAWEKLGETCNQFLRKGSKVYCAGRLQTRTWEKDGQKQYMTEVVLSEMIMLDAKNGDTDYAPTRTGPQNGAGYTAVQPVDLNLADLPF